MSTARVARPRGRPKSDASSQGGAETRDLILQVSAKLFLSQGYSATTLRQIADAAKIKAGSIYYHFSSKEEILQEILDTGINAVRKSAQERVAALPRNASSRAKIEAAMIGHLEGLTRHGGEFSSASTRVYGHLPAHLKKQNQKLRNEYSKFWDSLLDEAKTKGELRPHLTSSVARLVVVGAINWTTEWYDPKRDQLDEVVPQMVKMLSDGLFASAG